MLDIFAMWILEIVVYSLIILIIGSIAVYWCKPVIYQNRIIHWTLAGCFIVPCLHQCGLLPRISFNIFHQTAIAVTNHHIDFVSRDDQNAISHQQLQHSEMLKRDDVRKAVQTEFLQVEDKESLSEGIFSEVPSDTVSAVSVADLMPVIFRIVTTVFLSFAAYYLCQLIIAIRDCHRLKRNAKPASSEVKALLSSISNQQQGHVQLLVSDQIVTPVTWGIRPAVILLPQNLVENHCSPELRWALAHEWAHVKHRDAVGVWMISITKVFLFCQPLFWWMRQRLQMNQDYLADAFAVSQEDHPEDYASFLITLARQQRRPAMSHSLGIGDRPSCLACRVRELLSPDGKTTLNEKRRHTLLIASVAIGLFGILGLMDLTAAEPANSNLLSNTNENEKAADNNTEPQTLPARISYSASVVDEDTNEPISGATVTVVLRDSQNTQQPVVTNTYQTDHHGEYILALTPEQSASRSLSIEVRASHPNYQPSGRNGYSHAIIIKNSKLGDAPFFEKIRLAKGRLIQGVVKNPEGNTVSGLKMQAFTKSHQSVFPSYLNGGFQQLSTDADGRFEFMAPLKGAGVVWVQPDDYAIDVYPLPEGENTSMGTLVLKEGVRLKGKAIDELGAPVPGVVLRAFQLQDRETLQSRLQVGLGVLRQTQADSNGEYEFPPLGDGVYRIDVEQSIDVVPLDENFEHPSFEDIVFRPIDVTIHGDEITPQNLELRAIPNVVVRGRHLNSRGEPRSGLHVVIQGNLNDVHYLWRSSPAGSDGRFEARIPQGLSDAQVQLVTNVNDAVRWRISPDGPLTFHASTMKIPLGTLEEDFETLEVILYTAPVLVARATDELGKPLPGATISIEYTPDSGEETGFKLVRESHFAELGVDVICKLQSGGSWRTSQLLPDQEFTVTMKKEGWTGDSMTMSLAEGEVKEISIQLKKID